jgi:hypothetical protein
MVANGWQLDALDVIDVDNMTPIQLAAAIHDKLKLLSKDCNSDFRYVIDILKRIKSAYEGAPSEWKQRRNEAYKVHIATVTHFISKNPVL